MARKRVGLGQKSVARLLGYRCTSPISEYETGKLFPNLRTALKLSIIYQTPLPQLYASLYNEIEQEVEKARRVLPVNSGGGNVYTHHEQDPLNNPHSGR